MIIVELIKSLDNRDIALLLWFSVFIIWLATNKRFREPIKRLLAALFAKPILISIAMLFCYMYLMVYILAEIDIWDITQLKATIFWGATVGFKSLYDINENKAKKQFFQNKFKELLKVTLLLDCYVNLFKMPLLVELIFLPFMAFVFVMQAVSETKEEFQQVNSILSKFIVFVGTIILLYVSWRAYNDFPSIAKWQTLQNFGVPIILSLLLLPFTYATIIYSAYEEVFIRLKFIVKDDSLHRYTKWSLISNFKFKRILLYQWSKEAWSKDLASKEDIKRSIKEKIEV